MYDWCDILPIDQQTCIMKFGSWTFTGDQVSLSLFNNKNHVDLSDYWKSGTWDIIEVPAYLNVHNNTGKGFMPTTTYFKTGEKAVSIAKINTHFWESKEKKQIKMSHPYLQLFKKMNQLYIAGLDIFRLNIEKYQQF